VYANPLFPTLALKFHSLKMYPFGLVSRQTPSISKHGSALVLGVHNKVHTKERMKFRIWNNFIGQNTFSEQSSAGGSLPLRTPTRTAIEPAIAAPMMDQAIWLEASADSPVTEECPRQLQVALPA
jgi:hypothetical protein